jgi:hypothetical protein
MKVIVNTDHNITLSENSIDEFVAVVEQALEHVDSRLTRVEVHLTDESA